MKFLPLSWAYFNAIYLSLTLCKSFLFQKRKENKNTVLISLLLIFITITSFTRHCCCAAVTKNKFV